jgi:uncharacterized membrane protein YgaE (UPF0421/DUF939 family)
MTKRQVNEFLLTNPRMEKVNRFDKKVNEMYTAIYESMTDGFSSDDIVNKCQKLIDVLKDIQEKAEQLKLTDVEIEYKNKSIFVNQ